MGGLAIGLGKTFLIGVRVSGQPTYIPAHYKNGKLVNARITVPVMLNTNRGNNGQGRSDGFKLVAWNKLADSLARSCAPGKELHVEATPQSYVGKLFDANGNQRIDNMGQAIEVTKTSFVIDEVRFGSDSAKTIADEIGRGIRRPGWNIAGHPDQQHWQQVCAGRQAQVWDGSSQQFMFARVVVPQGQGIQLALNTAPPVATAPAATVPAAVAAVSDAMPAGDGSAPAPGYPVAGAPAYTPAPPTQAQGAAPLM